MKKINSFLFLIILLIGLSTIEFPVELRFQNPYLNYLFILILFILLPITMFSKAYVSKNKLAWFLTSSVVLFFSSIIIFMISFDLSDIKKYGIDPSFEVIQKVQHHNKFYRLYRTNGGATTDYGLLLREEKNLPLKLKLTKVLWKKYHEDNATLKLINPNKLKLEVQPYSTHKNVNLIEFQLDN